MMRPLLLALACLLAAPSAALADFDFTGSLAPTNLQAGAHADVVITTTFEGDENPDRVVVRFPPGLLGNPSSVPRCPVQTFRSGTCPGNTQVGTVTGSATLFGLPVIGGVSGTVSNLEGDPARLGIYVSPLGLGLLPSRNEAAVSLRPDGGLDSTIEGIAASLPAGAKLEGLEITLDSAFMTNPTSCLPATAVLEAAPVGGAAIQDSSTFTPTGCEAVPFEPSAAVALETPARAAPSGYTVTLSLPADQAHVRRAEVVLPEGTTLSPGVANGLEACTDAQFTQGACPAASQIGTVSFATPLIGTLGGTVAFGEPRGGAYRLLVEVDERGVRLDLAGTVTLDPRTGRITTVFDELPQVPFTSFALAFQGGDRAVLSNPAACGTYQLATRLTPWSGGADATPAASFDIGGECATPFAPSLAVAVQSTAAGRPAGAVTIDITRPDGNQELRRVTTELPPGLAGSIAGIELCPEDRANAGTCPGGSRLGSVSALAGPGGAPVALSGSVYLTGPAEGGIVGMAIVIPGRVGPVDLGTVVTRAGISLRPADGGLSVRTGELPRIVGGVPVSIRRLALRLDRPGFMVNASGCDPRTVRAVLEGSGGAVAAPTAPYQATDCAGLPFAPRVGATIGSARRPALRTVITVPPGQAATQTAAVTIPRGIGVDLGAIEHICTLEQQASGCDEGSRLGRAVARSPLLPVPLTGTVHVAVVPRQGFPGVLLDLRGPVSLKLLGTIAFTKAGLRTQFAGIPDVPLSRFELRFDRRRAIRVSRNMCTGKIPRVTAELAGHNGKSVRLRRAMRVTGCRPTAVLRRRGSMLRLRVNAARGGPALRRVRVTGLRASRVSARAGKRSLRARIRRGVLTVRAPRARTITITALGSAKRLKVTANGRRATLLRIVRR
jgi:hypothetical protein